MTTESKFTAIITEVDGRVATITLNRPEALNALNGVMVGELIEAADLMVVSEAWRPIRLALMAPHGTRLSDIRTAESHPVALLDVKRKVLEDGVAAKGQGNIGEL